MHGRAEFLAPLIETRPRSGRPPLILNLSTMEKRLIENEEWGKRDAETWRHGDAEIRTVTASPRRPISASAVRARSQNLIVQRASLYPYATVSSHRSNRGAAGTETYREFFCDATLNSNRKINA